MAPLPQNNTTRVFLDYTSVGVTHTFIVRLPDAATSIDAGVVAEQVAQILATRMSDQDTIFAARWQAEATNFSIPLLFDPIQGQVAFSGGAAYWEEDPESAFLSLTGRGLSTGRDVAWFLYTPIRTTTWPADNRYAPGESAPVDAFRQNWENLVNTGASDPAQQIVTIGKDIPVVRGYVNIAKNSYWQRKQR